MPDRQVMNGARARRCNAERTTSSGSSSSGSFPPTSPSLSLPFFYFPSSPLSLGLWSRLSGAGAVTSPHSQQPSSQPSRRRWGGFHGDGVSGLSIRGGPQLIDPRAWNLDVLTPTPSKMVPLRSNTVLQLNIQICEFFHFFLFLPKICLQLLVHYI